MKSPNAAVLVAVLACGISTTTAARGDDADVCATAAERSQPLRRAGKVQSARLQLLVCTREACPAVVKADCARWLADLDAAQPSVVVQARDSGGNDLTAVRVLLDGAALATRLDGRAIAVDPGEHTFRFERVGSAAMEAHVVVQEGERARVVAVTFPSPVASPAGSVPTPEAARTGIPAGAWVAGGVGVAALGVAAYFWASGLTDRSHLVSTCGATGSCDPSVVDTAKQKLVVGDVVAGGGVVAVGIAVWLALASRSASPLVDVHPIARGAVVGVQGQF